MFGFGGRKSEAVGRTGGAAGLTLTASEARAVVLPAGAARPRIAPLGTKTEALALVARLDTAPLELGASYLVRQAPHLVCTNFLPQLGTPRQWQAGRATITPEDATRAAFITIQTRLSMAETIGLALPEYLAAAQVKIALALAAEARLPVRGSVGQALAIAAHRAATLLRPSENSEPEPDRPAWVVPLRSVPGRADPTSASVVIVDCDEFAMSAVALAVEPGMVRVVGRAAWPKLGRKTWTDRLIDGLSDRCVRQCRRDPRDSAVAEQMLADQLDAALDAARAGRTVAFTVRTDHWFQDLSVTPADLAGFTHQLSAAASRDVADLVRGLDQPTPPGSIWVTHEAARLPGLLEQLPRTLASETLLATLPEFAAAEAVAALVPGWLAGTLPRAPIMDALTLPPASVPLIRPQTRPGG